MKILLFLLMGIPFPVWGQTIPDFTECLQNGAENTECIYRKIAQVMDEYRGKGRPDWCPDIGNLIEIVNNEKNAADPSEIKGKLRTLELRSMICVELWRK